MSNYIEYIQLFLMLSYFPIVTLSAIFLARVEGKQGHSEPLTVFLIFLPVGNLFNLAYLANKGR